MNKDKYCDKQQMLEWGERIKTLNKDALEILKNISEEKKILNENWIGQANKGFNNTLDCLILQAEQKHTEMLDIDKLLKEIVTVYDKQ